MKQLVLTLICAVASFGALAQTAAQDSLNRSCQEKYRQIIDIVKDTTIETEAKGNALVSLQELANNGSDSALVAVGLLSFLAGHAEDGFSYFYSSAIQGNSKAQYLVGDCYLRGNGTPQSTDMAMLWLEKAVEQKEDDAYAELALCYISQNINNEKVVELLKKGVDCNNPTALFTYGDLYCEGFKQIIPKNEKEGIKYIQRAADLGHQTAQTTIATAYASGLSGYPVNLMKSYEYSKAAADQGNALGKALTGAFYLTGTETIKPDYNLGLKYITEAANEDNDYAQYILGNAYIQGLYGLTCDAQLGAYWAQKSANQGNAAAISLLGLCYSIGAGMNKDLKKAFELYQKAADLNDQMGLYNLGTMYYNGTYVKRDYALAYKYLKKAADQNVGFAQFSIAKMYALGLYVKTDYAKAFKYFIMAEKNIDQVDNVAKAAFYEIYANLSDMYKNGWGTAKNAKMAKYYASKAKTFEKYKTSNLKTLSEKIYTKGQQDDHLDDPKK